ncbi:PspC domain-containing protein [Aurantibacter sp.]|uniref:PspC domain-containing protein n=1 Tax=Aurantibacter sp. TaxID=2807103 RepID=UPI003264C2E2
MNKTVNINLANVLFHIDEEAYNKMRRYLESVKRSFANTAGSDEIIADIEARIAELFHDKLENERQVITVKEVDEVIAIMGQPEDYMVDEDIFEDEPISSKAKTSGKRAKKFYRDTEQKYVAGVSAGLAHYFNIDPLWIRLLWIVLTIGSTGGFILIYGLLWILIPEATTTSQKLDMRGEAINISNIERKVKEGFDDVADKVKNADYSKVKNSGKTFFDTVGDIIMFLFKIFGKFIGIILILIGASVIIGMFIGMLTVGTLDWIHLPGLENVLDNITGTSVWVWSLLLFFAIGIPFFFLLYLGLKIMVNNLKSIGSIAKFSLLGLWIISIISLIIMGVKEAAAHAYSGGITTEKELYLENTSDTLNIELVRTDLWDNRSNVRMDDMVMTYDDDGEPILLSDDVRFRIKKSNDTVVRIEVKREANGPSVLEARSVAEKINYDYKVIGNRIILNDYLTTNSESKFKDQEVHVKIFIPVGTTLKYNSESDRNWTMSADTNRNSGDLEDFYWKMGDDSELICLECPDEEQEEEDENHIRINEDGIDININDNGEAFKLKVNEDGVNINANDNGDNVDINIDSDGVKINTDED